MDQEKAKPPGPSPDEVRARFEKLTGQPADGGYLALIYSLLGVDPPHDSRGALDQADAGDQAERPVDLDLDR